MSLSDDIAARPSPGGVLRSPTDISRWLRAARKRQGLTQDEVAKTAGISRQHLVDIEAGRPTQRLTELFELLRLLGLELVIRPRRPGHGSAD